MATRTYIMQDLAVPVLVTETGTSEYVYETVIISETTPQPAVGTAVPQIWAETSW